MDAAIHRGQLPLSQVYRRFARHEAHGVSPVYEAWAERVAGDDEVLGQLAALPRPKRQPNLVFAAARLSGAGDSYRSFRSMLLDRWDDVHRTILNRSTQTNEAARCAVLLPFLAALPQPLALLEVGASAGLCLLPDRYSYRYDDGTHLDPETGPSEVVIPCQLGADVPSPRALPQVAWRAGIDLSPVDIHDPESCGWLETLVWPGQDDRRVRLRAALGIARRDPPRVVRGDLNEVLPALASEAPSEATLVVFHTAVLAYLASGARDRFVDQVRTLPGHWISNEGRGVLPRLPLPNSPFEDDHRFVLALDGQPRALTDPHGRSIIAIDAA